MLALIGAIIGAAACISGLAEKRRKFNHERSINSTCRRESPSDDEWAGFAFATTPERFIGC